MSILRKETYIRRRWMNTGDCGSIFCLENNYNWLAMFENTLIDIRGHRNPETKIDKCLVIVHKQWSCNLLLCRYIADIRHVAFIFYRPTDATG